jgi:hypothetical protein
MSNHTPGPWKMVSKVHFETGLTYVSVQPETPDAERDRPLAMANGDYHVCRMSHTAAQHRINLYEANARLIAAAPDLLAAAKRFFILEVETCECDACTGWAKDLKAAISKAEGTII